MSSVAKYQRAGVPSEKMPFWNGLEDYLKTISTNAKQLKVWNMEDIKKLSTHVTEPNNSPILSPITSLPDNLTPLLDKDTAELREVNIRSFMFQKHFLTCVKIKMCRFILVLQIVRGLLESQLQQPQHPQDVDDLLVEDDALHLPRLVQHKLILKQ